MKTIIIPDLHLKCKWIEPFLKEQKYDEVCFLGDYFDHYTETRDQIVAMSEWLKESITKPNRIHCYGNHCIWYYKQIPGLYCSGNTKEKAALINQILRPEDWTKLKLVSFNQNFILSHAGISQYHFCNPVHGTSKKIIQSLCDRAMDELNSWIVHPILECGWSRGGRARVGGILWQDWNNDFRGVNHFNQIVGHTYTGGSVKNLYIPNKKNPTSENHCIDTWCKYIGIIEDGKFSTIENPFFTKAGDNF